MVFFGHISIKTIISCHYVPHAKCKKHVHIFLPACADKIHELSRTWEHVCSYVVHNCTSVNTYLHYVSDEVRIYKVIILMFLRLFMSFSLHAMVYVVYGCSYKWVMFLRPMTKSLEYSDVVVMRFLECELSLLHS